MSSKNVLMIARNKKVEALRMAAGLTLLDDIIKVAVVDGGCQSATGVTGFCRCAGD